MLLLSHCSLLNDLRRSRTFEHFTAVEAVSCVDAVQKQCADDTFSSTSGDWRHVNSQCLLGSAWSRFHVRRPTTDDHRVCRVLCADAEKWVRTSAGTGEGVVGENSIVVHVYCGAVHSVIQLAFAHVCIEHCTKYQCLWA